MGWDACCFNDLQRSFTRNGIVVTARSNENLRCEMITSYHRFDLFGRLPEHFFRSGRKLIGVE